MFRDASFSLLIHFSLLTFLVAFAAASPARAHDEHMLIGRSESNQLKWHPGNGVQNQELTVLAFIPPGGPIEGYSASVPGFGMVLSPSAENDVYPLAPGADVWLELVSVDAPLLMIETPSYRIINEQDPPEMWIGSGSTAHVHPLWLLETADPVFNPVQCVWEARFVFKDKGTTAYASSEVITLRFSAGRAPVPADFDCDGDVDADDLAIFKACVTGPSVPYDPADLPPGCTLAPDSEGRIAADFDRDGDVDMDDFAIFQRCYSGEDGPADPDCAGSD